MTPTIPIQVYGINLLVRLMVRGPRRRSRALSEGLADPLRRSDRARRRLRRGRQRVPRDARAEGHRRLRGVGRRGRGTLLLHRGRGVSRHPARLQSSCPFPTSSPAWPARASRPIKAALACVDEAELIELTRALIRISQRRPPGRRRRHRGRRRAPRRSLVRPSRGSTSRSRRSRPAARTCSPGSARRAAAQSLLLEGHTDVVTEGDPAEWTHPPFGAELVDGRIYGRGAADMKSGLAAAMIAAAAIKRSGAAL